jgi:hypothetical protein
MEKGRTDRSLLNLNRDSLATIFNRLRTRTSTLSIQEEV